MLVIMCVVRIISAPYMLHPPKQAYLFSFLWGGHRGPSVWKDTNFDCAHRGRVLNHRAPFLFRALTSTDGRTTEYVTTILASCCNAHMLRRRIGADPPPKGRGTHRYMQRTRMYSLRSCMWSRGNSIGMHQHDIRPSEWLRRLGSSYASQTGPLRSWLCGAQFGRADA